MLQKSEADPAIRHGVIALGLVDNLIRDSGATCMQARSDPALDFASQQYQRALQHLRLKLQSGAQLSVESLVRKFPLSFQACICEAGAAHVSQFRDYL